MQKQLIHTDKKAFQNAIENAETKKTILENAMEQFVLLTKSNVEDVAEFSKDFKAYTIKKVIEKHPEAKALGLKDDKLLSMYDYDLTVLTRLNGDYGAINSVLKFGKNNKIDIDVSEEPFKIYTENEIQNKKLEAINLLIKGVEAVHNALPTNSQIYQSVSGGYSGLVMFDLEENRLKPFYGAILRK